MTLTTPFIDCPHSYFADGTPSRVWIVRATGEDTSPNDATTGEGATLLKWRFVRRCAFCWRGPPFADYHDHRVCPLMISMNKIRANGGLAPISIDANSNKVVLTSEKIVKDYGEELRAIRTRVGKLEELVEKLSLKRKAKDKTKSPQTKKPKSDKEDKGKGKGKA